MEHGKVSGYSSGCRCGDCRAAVAKYMRERREARKIHRICAECGQEYQGLPDSLLAKSRRSYRRFCSKECAGTAEGSGARPAIFDRSHPLAGPDGRVAVHRKVLYDTIGPGEHPCYWCARPVSWILRTRSEGGREFDLMADHLDGNCRNNRSGNLVPACSFCNVLRGWIQKWERLTGRPVNEMRPIGEA
jgi:hypothetical protein